MALPQRHPAQQPDIRPAGLLDVPKIHTLLTLYADQGLLLPRQESDVYAALREFYVATEPGSSTLTACAALQIYSSELAEIRSLAVAARYQKQGIGRHMVEKIEHQARQIGLVKIIALTYEVQFFQRAGYRVVAMSKLPEKIWGACINCHKFRNCDEIAVLKYL